MYIRNIRFLLGQTKGPCSLASCSPVVINQVLPENLQTGFESNDCLLLFVIHYPVTRNILSPSEHRNLMYCSYWQWKMLSNKSEIILQLGLLPYWIITLIFSGSISSVIQDYVLKCCKMDNWWKVQKYLS